MSEFIKLLMDLIDDKTLTIMAVTIICLVLVMRGEIASETGEIVKIALSGLFGIAVGKAISSK